MLLSHGTPTRSPTLNVSTPAPNFLHATDDFVAGDDRQRGVNSSPIDHMQSSANPAAVTDTMISPEPATGRGRSRKTSGVRGRSSTMACMRCTNLSSN